MNPIVHDPSKIRNIAIIAHIDHGKTTLIDAIFKETSAFNEHAQVAERVMDGGALERERGITIKAKHCTVNWQGYRINVVDTPGHAVFSGEVERVLERKLSTVMGQDFTSAGGVDAVVNIINLVDRGTERNIIEAMEEQDPELAEEIKKRLFMFDDIIGLDDRSLQRVLREVDLKDLGLALKGASEELRVKFFRNMSKRAADMLKEDMDYMGPVKVRMVEEAQQKIVNVIRALEEAGEIVIARGGEEELLV